MKILSEKAKQSWSSGKVVFIIGSREIAVIQHSHGNGLNEDQARLLHL